MISYKNFSKNAVVYFEDEDGVSYRSSGSGVEQLYGESWEQAYDIKVPKEVIDLVGL